MVNSKNEKKTASLHTNEDNHTVGKGSNKISKKPGRRRFTPEYKIEILRQLQECRGSRGAVGELLRREGLYSSQVAGWRQELEGSLTGAFTKKRGPKPDPSAAAKKQIADLEQKIARLEKQLGQAHSVIDIQKKLSTILGVPLPEK